MWLIMNDDIIQQFLKRGKLLTPEALATIREKGAAAIDSSGLLVTGQKHEHQRHEQKDAIRILKNVTEVRTELTQQDFTKFYRSKYEKMKALIVARLQKDFVSLNKIDSYREETHAIGMVRSVKEKDGKTVVELEDPTATVPIVFEKGFADDVEADDVVAVRAVSAKNVMFGKQIIFPDVPLRQPVTGTGRVCFAPSPHLDEAPRRDAETVFEWLGKQDFTHIFFAGDIGNTGEFEKLVSRHCYTKNIFVIPGEKDSKTGYPHPPLDISHKNIIPLSNPSMVEINGVKILLSHNFSTNMLKKRYIGKPGRITGEDYLVMEETPDIVLFNHSQGTQVLNYKSVTTANPGSLLAGMTAIVIDLQTREAQQIDIAQTDKKIAAK